MDGQKEQLILLLENKQISLRSERVKKTEFVSLKYVPLEIRRKEAKKPLFLTRYE